MLDCIYIDRSLPITIPSLNQCWFGFGFGLVWGTRLTNPSLYTNPEYTHIRFGIVTRVGLGLVLVLYAHMLTSPYLHTNPKYTHIRFGIVTSAGLGSVLVLYRVWVRSCMSEHLPVLKYIQTRHIITSGSRSFRRCLVLCILYLL